jgi:hypothetical protein
MKKDESINIFKKDSISKEDDNKIDSNASYKKQCQDESNLWKTNYKEEE